MFQKMLENVRGKCPLIHNITNYVTVNDCANIVLACGASPISPTNWLTFKPSASCITASEPCGATR